jgi:manganese/iron transport system substrate-binding protein
LYNENDYHYQFIDHGVRVYTSSGDMQLVERNLNRKMPIRHWPNVTCGFGAALFSLSLFFALFVLAACSSPPAQEALQDDKLSVLATTTIVGDVVAQIGGDAIELSTLLPYQSDPHNYEPTPQDIARVAGADVIFANGAGLEEFLEPLIESAGAEAKVIELSEDIDLIGNTSSQEAEHGGDHGDPHVWTDPNNVILWTQVISAALIELEPSNTEVYMANAEAYQEQLIELDAWIREQVGQIPPANRNIVTDHLILVYFTDRYGFTQTGAIIPGYSTLSEPSAQELAGLVDKIGALNVPAIFVGNTINPNLANRLAEDTGTQLVTLYTGSLSEPGGEADNYLDYMKYNVNAIVNTLK